MSACAPMLEGCGVLCTLHGALLWLLLAAAANWCRELACALGSRGKAVMTANFNMYGAANLCKLTSELSNSGLLPYPLCRGKAVKSADFNMYGAANLCKLMAGKEMARRLEGSGGAVFVVEPGMSQTDLFEKMVSEKMA